MAPLSFPLPAPVRRLRRAWCRVPRRVRPLVVAGALVTTLAVVLPAPSAAAAAPLLPPAGHTAPTPQLPLTAVLRLLVHGLVRRPGTGLRAAAAPARAARAIAGMARRMAPPGDACRGARLHDACTC